MIQALIQHKADINAKDSDGNTPCHFCSEYGHRYCLKFLLTKQPYLFSSNNEDKSAIDVAINNDILTEFQEFITKSNNKKATESVEPTKPKFEGNPTKSETSISTNTRISNRIKNA